MLRQWCDRHAVTAVGGILLLESFGNRAEIRACLLKRDAGLEPSNCRIHVRLAGLFSAVGDNQREPDLSALVGEGETWWHDTDDRSLASIELDQFADDTAIGAEARAPESITDERDGVVVRDFVLSGVQLPDQRAHADCRERLGRQDAGTHALRLAGARQVDTRLTKRREESERTVLRLEVGEIGIRVYVLVHTEPPIVHPHHHDPLCVGKGEWLEDDAVDNAEDRGGRADA